MQDLYQTKSCGYSVINFIYRLAGFWGRGADGLEGPVVLGFGFAAHLDSCQPPSFFAKTGGKSDVPAPQSFPQFRGILPLPRIGEGGGDAKPVRHSLSWQVSPLESSHLAPVAVSQKSTKKRSLSDMVRDLHDRMPKKASA